MLLTWALEGLGRKISFDLGLHASGTLGAHHFHIESISDDPTHVGLDHIGLVKTSIIFFLILDRGLDVIGTFAYQLNECLSEETLLMTHNTFTWEDSSLPFHTWMHLPQHKCRRDTSIHSMT